MRHILKFIDARGFALRQVGHSMCIAKSEPWGGSTQSLTEVGVGSLKPNSRQSRKILLQMQDGDDVHANLLIFTDNQQLVWFEPNGINYRHAIYDTLKTTLIKQLSARGTVVHYVSPGACLNVDSQSKFLDAGDGNCLIISAGVAKNIPDKLKTASTIICFLKLYLSHLGTTVRLVRFLNKDVEQELRRIREPSNIRLSVENQISINYGTQLFINQVLHNTQQNVKLLAGLREVINEIDANFPKQIEKRILAKASAFLFGVEISL